MIGGLIRREWLISIRSGTETLIPLAFFALVMIVFGLTFGADKDLLHRCVVPILWITSVFANTLSLDQIFKRDHDDGTLAQTLLTHRPSLLVIVTKLVCHWTLTSLPLCLLAPLFGRIYGLPWDDGVLVMLTLIIGLFSITLIGSLVAALLIGTNKGGQVLLLVVLPLYVPVILLGIGIYNLHSAGLSFGSPLLGSLAILTAAITCTPLALKPLLRTAQDS